MTVFQSGSITVQPSTRCLVCNAPADFLLKYYFSKETVMSEVVDED
ncbi:hypothetical protein CFBP7900_21080 [Xanthomonas hortorum pv. carotae]|uniref:Uncharacterized protein n=1 Tax=Xanthomonas hortorum pv. carotae TaxID=487904 RepID=A0A6V7DGS1_9XANT|nr:hypothetical protein XHC_2500 [Xanthomonas hortorum pv. carotae str. M081]CAD0334077.1 hypothetical protein CFBP7900_21080 [Xanthomonas hortorum pv. carotae]CAD0334085.1 hypothetical protein CFBP7900_21080 [Xanthomonas hortorum pv. carotae]